jgi:NitT/TauT family transport system permease protein
VKRWFAPVVGVVVFFGLWEAYVRIGDVERFVLLPPSVALEYLWDERADFLAASWVTLWHAVGGLLIALVAGVLIGGMMASSRFVERATTPVLTLVMVTPFVAYMASVVIWLGFNDKPVLFLVALVCTPAFAYAANDGMRGADPAARELLESVDASRWDVIRRLRLPSAVPILFTAARVNVGLALISAYLGENANYVNEGLGPIGSKAAIAQTAEPLWAAVFAMMILGTVMLLSLSALARVVLHWHPSQRSGL